MDRTCWTKTLSAILRCAILEEDEEDALLEGEEGKEPYFHELSVGEGAPIVIEDLD